MSQNGLKPSMFPAPNRFQYASSFIGTYQHVFICQIIPGNWVKRCVVFVARKFAKCVFSVPFCTSSAEGARSLQGSMPCELISPCKNLSQSVLICQNYCWKSDFVQIRYVALAYNNNNKNNNNSNVMHCACLLTFQLLLVLTAPVHGWIGQVKLIWVAVTYQDTLALVISVLTTLDEKKLCWLLPTCYN